MNIIRKFAAMVAIAVAGISGLATFAAGPASAAGRPPVIYNESNGWATSQVRPGYIYIGEGGSPIARTQHWGTWNSKAARSTGTLITNDCNPNCAYGTDSYYKLYVVLSGVKHHNGRAYYSVMTWYTPGLWMIHGGHPRSHTVTMHFAVRRGGSAPFWY